MKKWGVGQHGRQLLNLNGPPHLSLRIDKQLRLVSRYHTGAAKNPGGKNQYGNVGRNVSPQPLAENKGVVAVSVYDPAKNSSRLYLDGVLVSGAKARKLDATNSPRYIGSHMFLPNTHFFGDLSELMIYDIGLTDKEALNLSRSLMIKYSIEASTPPRSVPADKT